MCGDQRFPGVGPTLDRSTGDKKYKKVNRDIQGMDRIAVGDRVRLILDKAVGPDTRWHGETGTVTRILQDAAGEVTGDPLDSLLFEVELDSGETPDIH